LWIVCTLSIEIMQGPANVLKVKGKAEFPFV
jgi:hypothetical protein